MSIYVCKWLQALLTKSQQELELQANLQMTQQSSSHQTQQTSHQQQKISYQIGSQQTQQLLETDTHISEHG